MEFKKAIEHASAAMGVGQFDDAAKILDGLLEDSPAHPQARFTRAVVAVEIGDR